ncbi:Uncharacterised protein [Candidatus Norongarragalina meridionalis]|nr:Uncharacterised protein [Candidatus Norongarragalina meridionalis]
MDLLLGAALAVCGYLFLSAVLEEYDLGLGEFFVEKPHYVIAVAIVAAAFIFS